MSEKTPAGVPPGQHPSLTSALARLSRALGSTGTIEAIEGETVEAALVRMAAEQLGKPTGQQGETPLSDALEQSRRELGQERTPAYGDALALCRRLEGIDSAEARDAARYRWLRNAPHVDLCTFLDVGNFTTLDSFIDHALAGHDKKGAS